jgi:translation initiation factor IF-2
MTFQSSNRAPDRGAADAQHSPARHGGRWSSALPVAPNRLLVVILRANGGPGAADPATTALTRSVPCGRICKAGEARRPWDAGDVRRHRAREGAHMTRGRGRAGRPGGKALPTADPSARRSSAGAGRCRTPSASPSTAGAACSPRRRPAARAPPAGATSRAAAGSAGGPGGGADRPGARRRDPRGPARGASLPEHGGPQGARDGAARARRPGGPRATPPRRPQRPPHPPPGSRLRTVTPTTR